MYSGKVVFSQVMEFLPLHIFHQCVDHYHGDYKVKEFTCLDQYYCMAFAQITYRESLRDIEACLRAQQGKLYHMGIRGPVSRNTLANANKVRDWRIYADLAHSLIATARKLYSKEVFIDDLNETVYALDATTIDLCLSVFPWAHFRKTKGAIKLHTLLDLRSNIPSFIHISDGKLHEVNTLDIIPVEPGSFYIMDRGYLDYARLYALSQASAFFITRAKSNMKCRRVYSHPVDRGAGLICDQSVLQTVPKSARDYPEKLRRVEYYDAEADKTLIFVTNNFVLPALTVSMLYQLSLAGRAILQVDQAEPPNQDLLRHFGECSQDSNMDRCLGIRARSHHEKAAKYSGEPLHNFTGPERLRFRENAAFSATCKTELQKRAGSKR